MRAFLVVLLLLGAGVARAQSTTTGAIRGRVVDQATHEPIEGATVVAKGIGERVATTISDGTFVLTDLVPGAYRLTYYVPGKYVTVERDARVAVLTTTWVAQSLSRSRYHVGGIREEIIRVAAPAEPLDPRVFDRRYLLGVPLPGVGFDGGAAPGGRGDAFGTGFHEASSVDNRHFVDGIDATDPAFGLPVFALPRELLEGVTVSAPAPSAEYGRAIGVQVASVLRPGTNQLRGMAFVAYEPGALRAEAVKDRLPPATIEVERSPVYDAIAGVQLDGPVLKNRLWFSLGVAARASRVDHVRTVQRRVDADADAVPDVDPSTGFVATEVVDSSAREALAQSLPLAARLDYAGAEDRGQLVAIAVPAFGETPALFGAASTGRRLTTLSTAVGGSWTWRHEGHLELRAEAGWNRIARSGGSIDPAFDSVSRTDTTISTISEVSEHESERVREGCTEGAGGRYPLIATCPLSTLYASGGPGRLVRDHESRLALRLSMRERVYGAGEHELMLGVDADVDTADTSQALSGGVLIRRFDAGAAATLEPVLVAAVGDEASGFPLCGSLGVTLRCRPATSVDAASRTLAVYARDAWRPRHDLVVEAGVRVEVQQVLYPRDLRGGIHPITEERLGEAALSIHRAAPRAAIAYDFTGEGRGSLFVRAARLVEPVRTEVVERALTRLGQRSMQDLETGLSFGRTTVDPDTQAGYTDEAIAGVNGEPWRDVYLGAWIHHRRLGTTIEDVLAEDQRGFVIGNPGAGQAAHTLVPTRTYDAFVLAVARRTARFNVLASYAYARTRGNYTGSVDHDAGSIASNVSRQFDLFELGANRGGLLPQDTPHLVKLDATYEQPLGQRQALLFGARMRFLSGAPIAAFDGGREVLLLPRGAFGRIDMARAIDVRVGYRRMLARSVLDVYVDALDASDAQAVAAVETRYTLSSAQALSPGAGIADLVWLKDGAGRPVERNPGFGRAVSRFAPAALRLGARLTF